MGEPAKPIETPYEQLLAAPSHFVAEIIRGVLVTQPRPAPRHARAASVLGIRLGGPFDLGEGGPGGWLNLDMPEIHLGEHVLVPDLAGWRRERMPGSASPTSAVCSPTSALVTGGLSDALVDNHGAAAGLCGDFLRPLERKRPRARNCPERERLEPC